MRKMRQLAKFPTILFHSAGTALALEITLIRSRPSREQVSKVIKSTMKDYARTMKKRA